MIRQATAADIARITAIYNETIAEGGWTGDLDPLPVENRHAWFLDHQVPYAVLVKELDGQVVGYVALSPYRKGRKAFDGTCEINYYLSAPYRGRGFGKALIDHAIAQAARGGFHLMVAIILASNQRSIDLLMRRGFTVAGRLPEAARIDGTYCDHVYLSRRLGSADSGRTD
jgi:L-amino acid N-acyltransferase YncA